MDAITVPAVSRRLAELFTAAGHELYLVGGIVRDALLGVNNDDLDFATSATPDQTLALVRDVSAAWWTTGAAFGTIACQIGPDKVEITTYRSDAYDGQSRKPIVQFGDSLLEDLRRRDFTINAIAADAATGTVVDPFHGAADLTGRLLRTPADARVTMAEDPLRMLRAVRFATRLSMKIELQLDWVLCDLAPELARVAVERQGVELSKMLMLPNAADAAYLLNKTGLDAAVLGRAGHVQPLKALLSAVPDASWPQRLATWVGGTGSATDSAAVLARLKLSADVSRQVKALLAAARHLPDVGADPAELRRWWRDHHAVTGPAWQLAAVHSRHVRDVLTPLRDDLAARAVLDTSTDPLTGTEVMSALGIGPGRAVGDAVTALRELAIVTGPLTRDQALTHLGTLTGGAAR